MVSGRSIGEEIEAYNPPAPDGAVVHPLSDPIHAGGGLAVLRGSLAPRGSVVKVAGLDTAYFDGPARVFDGEDAAMADILAGRIQPGTVVVIRYEGPRAARACGRCWPSPERSKAPGAVATARW
jgi:dihydroxy-acid dehydratase